MRVRGRLWLPVVFWSLAAAMTVVCVYGLARERLFAQNVWEPLGLLRLKEFAVAYLLAAVALRFLKKVWGPAVLVGCSAVYAAGAIGLGPCAAAVLFAATALVVGDALLTAAGLARGELPVLESAVLSFLAGLAALTFAIGMAAYFPVNYRSTYFAASALAIVLNRRALAYYAQRLARGPVKTRGRRDYIPAALLGFVLLMHFLIVLKPEVSYDGLTMHLFVPAYVEVHHVWSFDPGQLVWAVMPMAGDWAYTGAYLLGGEFAARMANFFCLAALAAAVYCLTRRHLPRPVSLLLVALFASTPLVQLVTGSLFVENPLAAFLAGAVVALDRLRRTGRAAYLLALSLLLGAAMASKAGALGYMAPWLALAAVLLTPARARRPSPRWILACALVFIVVGGLPYFGAWRKTGNPVYPFLNTVFRSPGYPPVTFENPFHPRVGADVLYQITFRSQEFLESRAGAAGLQHLYLVPIALLAFVRRRAWAARAALAGGLAGCVSVLYSQPNLRYLYPGLILFGVAAAAPLAVMRRAAPRLFHGMTAGIVVLILLNVYFTPTSGWYHRTFWNWTLFDSTENDTYRLAFAPSRSAIDFLNMTNPGRPAWFLQTEQVAGLAGRAYSANWHHPEFRKEVAALRSSADVMGLVKKYRLQHIVAPSSLPDASGVSVPVRTFLAEHATSEYEAGSFAVYRVRDEVVATELFPREQFRGGWQDWQRNGNVSIDGQSGAATVTLSDTLVHGIRVNEAAAYDYSMEASCPQPGTVLRLQINWHDARGAFIDTTIDPRSCDAPWRTYSRKMRPPARAASGVVIVGGHGRQPVLVRWVSLKSY